MQKLTKIASLILLVFTISLTVSAQIPEFFNAPRVSSIDSYRRNGCDYLIITPDNDDIKQWADTLRNFRESQGIITKALTISSVSPNDPDTLKAFLNNVYEEWSPCPAAVLLLGDYNSDPARGITSYALTNHPNGQQYEPYLADNKLVDFNNDGLPDMVIARMPASNGNEAKLMVQKTLNYERHPYTDESYYAHPVTAMGFHPSRWFQLCTEIIAGYLDIHGKQVTRLNTINQGTPDSIWSTGQRTEEVLSYFGPDGLGYIPATMSHLTDWNAGAEDITNAINDGTYLFIHRDHGTFTTWGEPYFSNSLVNELQNDKLTFVMSANCQTGDFSHHGDCLAERFLRIQNGAVGIIAASQLSFSFVNDTYVWGFFDYLYPDFMPDYGAQSFDFQYPAFANAYGKYYLKQSSFPYNASYKTVTCQLFHYFGDAYLQLYSEVPQHLTVTHPQSISTNTTSVPIYADEGSIVALSVDNQLIARRKANGHDMLVSFSIPQHEGDTIKVVVTKQNHYRHESFITVTDNIGVDETFSESRYCVYPNPVDDIMFIEGVDIHNIRIINTLGQETMNESYPQGCNSVSLDCGNLNHGIYYVIISGQNTVVRMFIKK